MAYNYRKGNGRNYRKGGFQKPTIQKLPPVKIDNPSKYQSAIFGKVQNGNGHIVIEATAGSGKTTTIVAACQMIAANLKIIFLAFNKSIANELAARVPDHCQASTFHSAGNSALYAAFGRCKLNPGKTRDALQAYLELYHPAEQKELYRVISTPIANLVSLAKAHLVFSGDELVSQWEKFATRFGIDVSFDKIDRNDFEEILSNLYERVINDRSIIDYDDQIFLPIFLDLPVRKYDYVMVDESQDMNPARHELALRMLAANGRMIIVGDSYQAIYGFTGADTDSIATMRNHLADRGEVETLPLSICYRCSKAVIEKAKEFCPSIEAHESAPDGLVETISYEKFLETVASGDYVLCRTSAPTISGCLALIREGRKAKVLGRELIKGLISLLKKADKATQGTNNILDKLANYRAVQTEKMQGEESKTKIMALQDKVDCLTAVVGHAIEREDWNEANAIEIIESTLEEIFTDDDKNPGVTFSTIHKAKGLEADNVFIFHPELLPHPMAQQDWEKVQEKNLAFVAATRAKINLRYVDMGERKASPKGRSRAKRDDYQKPQRRARRVPVEEVETLEDYSK